MATLNARIDKTKPSSVGAQNGVMSAIVTKGSGSFSYLWSTGSTASQIQGIPSGTYGVTITDNGTSETLILREELSALSIPPLPTSQLYNNKTKFFLVRGDDEGNRLEIREPIGWDTFEMTIKRDEEFFGTVFQFSDGDISLRFGTKSVPGERNPKKFIDDFFIRDGTDASVFLEFGTFIDDSFGLVFRGELDFNTYSSDPFFVRVGIRQTYYGDRIRTRFDIPTDALSTLTLDEEPKSPVPLKEMDYFTPRLSNVLDMIHEVTVVQPLPNSTAYGFLPDTVLTDELGVVFTGFEPNPNFTNPVIVVEFERDGVVSLEFEYWIGNGAGVGMQPEYEVRSAQGAQRFYTRTFTSGRGDYDHNGDSFYIRSAIAIDTFQVFAGDTFRIIIFNQPPPQPNAAWLALPDGMPISTSGIGSGNFTVRNRFKITQNNVGQWTRPSSARFLDVLQSCLQNITGLSSVCDSPFFGGADSWQRIYSPNGCGYLSNLLSGYLLRTIEGEGFTVTLNELMTAAKGIFGVGFNISTEADGVTPVFEVNRIETFFRDVLILRLPNDLDDYSTYPATDFIANTIKYGFTSSVDEDGTPSSFDSFHNLRERANGVIKNKKELDLSQPFIADSYEIERTRAETPVNEEDISTYKNDKAVFITSTIETNVYRFPVSSQLFCLLNSSNNTVIINRSLIREIVPGDNITIDNLSAPFESQTFTVNTNNIDTNNNIMTLSVSSITINEEFDNWTLTFNNREIQRPENVGDGFTASSVTENFWIYNPRFSPLSCLYNNARYINSIVYSKDPATLNKYISGSNNENAICTFAPGGDAECEIGNPDRVVNAENADIPIDQFNRGERLFLPIFHEFSVDLSFQESEIIRRAMTGISAEKYGFLQFQLEGKIITGFVWEMRYNFVSGKTHLKLIESEFSVAEEVE